MFQNKNLFSLSKHPGTRFLDFIASQRQQLEDVLQQQLKVKWICPASPRVIDLEDWTEPGVGAVELELGSSLGVSACLG